MALLAGAQGLASAQARLVSSPDLKAASAPLEPIVRSEEYAAFLIDFATQQAATLGRASPARQACLRVCAAQYRSAADACADGFSPAPGDAPVALEICLMEARTALTECTGVNTLQRCGGDKPG
jgi:hypothetical protein